MAESPARKKAAKKKTGKTKKMVEKGDRNQQCS
jgi:hypothetical protein